MENPRFLLDSVKEVIIDCRSLADVPVVLGGQDTASFRTVHWPIWELIWAFKEKVKLLSSRSWNGSAGRPIFILN